MFGKLQIDYEIQDLMAMQWEVCTCAPTWVLQHPKQLLMLAFVVTFVSCFHILVLAFMPASILEIAH